MWHLEGLSWNSAPSRNSSSKGAVLFLDLEVRVAEKSWYAPPVWNGIFLKDPVTGKEMDGTFSYHLVPVEVEQTFITPPRKHQTVSAGDDEFSLLARRPF